jgi:hypothetical protein
MRSAGEPSWLNFGNTLHANVLRGNTLRRNFREYVELYLKQQISTRNFSLLLAIEENLSCKLQHRISHGHDKSKPWNSFHLSKPDYQVN